MANDLIHILLIEDSPGSQALLRESLSAAAMPFKITCACSLAEAQRVATADAFNLIMLDLSLPDGREPGTVKAAIDAFSSLPIIVLTELSADEIGPDAVRAGAQDYLLKGHLTPELLRRVVRYAMERHAAQRALLQAQSQLGEQVQLRTGELAGALSELDQEVRERLSAEEELRRANQFMRMVSECNQALVRIEDEAVLTQRICQTILDVGGYRMAWVGYAENDAEKSVRPVGSVGFEEGYLENARITWADNERGRGPTGTAIRLGKPIIGDNFLVDPELAPWREQALQRGFRSSVALPLAASGRVFGALTIYASEPAGFGEMETGILASLADDLAFGITALRTRSELRESRQHLERMVHSAPVIIWAVDLRGYYTLADGKLEALGLRTDRVVGRHLKDIVGDHADILDHFGRAIQGEQVTAQVEFCGMILESAYSPLRDEKHQITGVICVSTDITDQRRVEREVLTATEHEQNRIGQDLHDSIQGNLTGIGFMLAAHKQHLLQENRRQADLVTQVDRLASLVTETIKQTRGLARALCPVDLKGDGLAKSLEQLATTTSSLFNVDCHCQCEPLVLLADELAAKQLYHIAQEALNNILKHARARSISIRLDQDKKELILTIEDDGVGMPERAAQAQGMGLRTMNYRARLVGAALTILRGPSGGTTVKCVLPHRAI